MILHRICSMQYREDLSGTGAKMFGGRWNSKGIAALYLTEYISLSVLEMLVHTQFKDFFIELSLLNISIPDTVEIKEIKLQKMKADWIEDYSYTKFIGNEFIKSGDGLILKVPSAIVNEEHNFIINPAHSDFKKIKIFSIKNFKTDKRLFTL